MVKTPPHSHESATSEPNLVTALVRGLELLRCFGQAQEYLGNAELAARIDVPRPTVSRLTATLTHLGYLVYSPTREKYRLGPRVLDLGYRYLANEGVGRMAEPLMQTLADATDCLIAIGVPDGLDMIYIHACQGPGPLILRLQVGSRVPMAYSALGRAYLAACDPTQRARHHEQIRQADPQRWPATQQALVDAYDDYQRLGFCMVHGEWSPDISGVGVPLALEAGQRILAFNCGGSALRLTRGVMQDNLGPRLLALVDEVDAALTGQMRD